MRVHGPFGSILAIRITPLSGRPFDREDVRRGVAQSTQFSAEGNAERVVTSASSARAADSGASGPTRRTPPICQWSMRRAMRWR